MTTSDNPPAFPTPDCSNWDGPSRTPGMTLRDYFAGQALAAMDPKHDGQYSPNGLARGEATQEASWLSASAYRHADAMLAERAKREGRK